MRWLVVIALVSCASAEKDFAWFEQRDGEAVTLVGVVATTEWQHMTGGVPGKQIVYIDLDGGKHQVVAHFARPPVCPSAVAFEGTVFAVRGATKAGPRAIFEYAVDVASWTCR